MSSQTTDAISRAIAEALSENPWQELEDACKAAECEELVAFLTSDLRGSRSKGGSRAAQPLASTEQASE